MRGDLCLNEILVYHLIEIALRIQQIVHRVKHDLRFREFSCALGDAGFDLVVNQQRRFAVKNDLDRPVHTAGNDFGCRCAVVTIDRRCAATPHDKASGDFYVGQRDLAVRNTVADDEIAVNGHILQFNVLGADKKIALVVLRIAAALGDIRLDDVEIELCKLGSCDIGLRDKTLCAAMHITCCNHCLHVRQCPCRHFLRIRKLGQIRLGVIIQIKLQSSCHNCNGLLTGDCPIRLHAAGGNAVIRSHLDGECDIFVVPLGFCNVLVRRNVRSFITAKRPVCNGSHFRTGQQPVGVKLRLGFAVKQAVIYSRRHGFGVPRFGVHILEI